MENRKSFFILRAEFKSVSSSSSSSSFYAKASLRFAT
jgi:hypothetical protein